MKKLTLLSLTKPTSPIMHCNFFFFDYQRGALGLSHITATGLAL